MSFHVLYESCPGHTRAALFNDHGKLVSLRYDDPSRPLIESAIIYGRVRSVQKALGSAFVDIGDVEDGVLPLKTLPPELKIHQGLALPVRVVRGGFSGKGARLDARVAIPTPPMGTPAPSVLQAAPNALTRVLHDAGAQPITVWVPDARLRDAVRARVPERLIKQLNDSPADWLARLDTELDRLATDAPAWPFALPGGGEGGVVVEMTSAVATMDINAMPTGRGNPADVVLAANMAAAAEVVRLAKLLDLGGSVVVDFITPRSKAHRDVLTEHVRGLFSQHDDRLVDVRPVSRFGLLEINRERSGPSLSLLLKTPAYVAGRALLELWRVAPGSNPHIKARQVVAHPSVATHLTPQLRQETCLQELGYPVQVVADGALPVAQYRLLG